ncbi:calcium-binding protein, partial [Fulvivirga sp. M361]|uniref:Calx-beta domain-containing protein n=2 Tax=Fulvivirga sp. M361 TaxID=2594266 RepID=UPI001196AB83
MMKALFYIPLFSLICALSLGQTVELSLSANAGTEGTGPVIDVIATTSSNVIGSQTVDVTVSGTGITTDDYILSNTTITIADGTNMGTVTFTIEDDVIDEFDETASIQISNPGPDITPGTVMSLDVTITDNDPEPTVTLSASSNTIAENGGSTTLTAELSAISGKDVTVNLSYINISTTAADYSGATSIVIPAGDMNATTAITGQDDSDVEGDESFTVEIASVTNGVEDSTPQEETITITDDDIPAPTTVELSLSANAGTEGTGPVIDVIATTSSNVIGPQTVDVTVSGTGITTDDYILSNTTITIANGTNMGTVTFTIEDDAIDEFDETASIQISNPGPDITPGTVMS